MDLFLPQTSVKLFSFLLEHNPSKTGTVLEQNKEPFSGLDKTLKLNLIDLSIGQKICGMSLQCQYNKVSI